MPLVPAITQTFLGHDSRGATFSAVGTTTFIGCFNGTGSTLYELRLFPARFEHIPAPTYFFEYGVTDLAPVPFYECCPNGLYIFDDALGPNGDGVVFQGSGAMGFVTAVVTVDRQPSIGFAEWYPPPAEGRGWPFLSDYPASEGVILTATPEPATLALVGGGLLTLGGVMRRRTRQ